MPTLTHRCTECAVVIVPNAIEWHDDDAKPVIVLICPNCDDELDRLPGRDLPPPCDNEPCQTCGHELTPGWRGSGYKWRPVITCYNCDDLEFIDSCGRA